ncbi:TPA: recombinase family protein [Streptococcus pneumoniae]|uniref:recombinase family protein n=2 Tax=Streptococcus pneumoniae TaxID=1313 RepID=UPI0007651195|nr:recombinase family protein [Streptococcus pneumoniae]MBW7534686.1 recombinase family protein [Streptococcus pneumoniae]MDV8538310.1 recombinase family protein [Streptococcus pneumoniae]MDV8540105.1 recombinase family protein [Streptococcus pneumoniae]MDV8614408.1 recombinase family protein [Streptococcus pneumoniae]MDV8673116.1 recombinase family protein [Streptococcus pneumoniae]
MSKEKIKVYLYTRVSTSIQIEGYSLEAQKSRMKAFAIYNDYEIVGEYEDAGKSGKSIEGRIQFNRMMEDIKSGKDGVSFVLVFKLSRFARNAADVLSTLHIMQDYGVNLICVEDGIDSSKDAGKLMISVLSAVAEIEREIDNYQKELRKSHSTKFKLIEEIDNLDVEDKHYKRRKQDLDDRLYRMYDKLDELESSLIDAKAKKQTIEAEKLTGDNIYKVLIYFDKLYKVMNDVERRQLISALISEIQVYEEKQSNGQWLKSITFKLPIIEENLNIGLDNDEQVECVSLLEKRS